MRLRNARGMGSDRFVIAVPNLASDVSSFFFPASVLLVYRCTTDFPPLTPLCGGSQFLTLKEALMTHKVLMFLLASWLFVFPAFAQTQPPLEAHAFEIGVETYYMNYEEPGIMENEGWMYGVIGSYTYRKAIMARVEARLATGEVDYSSVNTGSADNITDVAFETRGLLGYDLRRGSVLFTPYIGLGYRYLNDDSEGTVTTTGALGYERESNYYYTPIGLEMVVPLRDRWTMGLTGEYDHFWSGKQKSLLSGAVAGLSDIENDQDNGHGLRSTLSFKKRYGSLALNLGVFLRYWWVDDSEVVQVSQSGRLVAALREPENETYEAGLMLSLYF